MTNTACARWNASCVVVTGKGGVGKSTIAAALGSGGGRRGLRTIVVELGDQRRLPALFGRQGRAARAGRSSAETASDEPVEHHDRPRPGAAGVAAGARRAGARSRARSQRHVPVLRRRRPRRARAGEHGQGLGADPRRALAPARAAAMTWSCSTPPRPDTRWGCCSSPRDVRRDRPRRADLRPGRADARAA